jgi:2-polyprenyl-3-methyl-5-hydroxy-6-metoxy-1,4-benzoquinol methylase
MSVTFTGERLHEGDELFAVDLARHRAAYEIARERLPRGWVLDLGCGSGYGSASLAEGCARVVGLDRVRPDAGSRAGGARFVRARLEGLPFARGVFELVVSFQVIEHFADPTLYVDALAELVRLDGSVLVTTPNRLTSDGVNPYHAHEYVADELAACLGRRFARVEVLGIGASEPVRRYLEARSRRIQRIVRLDPLRLRERLPRALVERLFAGFALLVRRRTSASEGAPDASWRDFPVGPAADDSIDLLAVCREPR